MTSPPHTPATAPSRTTPLAVARFDGVRDTRPKSRWATWDDFVGQLQPHDRRQHKDGPLFSPCAYLYGARRGSRFVRYLSMLVVDYDGTAPNWPLLEHWGLTYATYSTWSHWLRDAAHPLPGPRWRAVFPLAEDVPGAIWPGVYARALQLFPGADPACKDAARLHFLPSCPLEPPVEPEVRFRDTGLALHTAALLAVVPSTGGGRPSQAWAARLLRDGAPQGERNAGCFRLACFFHHFGLPEDVIAAVCSGYGRRCRPAMDEAEVQTVVAGVCRRYEPGQEVTR